MKIYELQTQVRLPRPIDEVFRFFADAHNLETLTPPWLKFHVLTPKPITMAVGAKIDYKLRIRGLPLRWRSEITVWEPPFRFQDEQLRGPYRRWSHEHTFQEADGMTLAGDYVRYAVPGGDLAHWLFVKRDVEKIFEYRTARMRSLFASPAGSRDLVPAPSAR